VIYIPNSEKKATFMKGYVIIFILGIISLLIGFVIETLVPLIPDVDFGDPGYEEYIDLIMNLGAISTLFLNIGLGLFFMSTFIGAITDKHFSIEVKKGMLIASVLGIIALVLFNYVGLYFLIDYF